jgi:creatinine amidohydrolase/Fe(II)-dependent formamide hydrolase-like protein
MRCQNSSRTIKVFLGNGEQTGDHAGKVETSLLWALRPDCVDISRVPDFYKMDEAFAMGPDAKNCLQDLPGL